MASELSRTCDGCNEVKPDMNYIQQIGDEHNSYVHVCFVCQPRPLKLANRQIQLIKFKLDAFQSLFGGVPRKADQRMTIESY